MIATVLDGYLWAGYSQYSETVSTLTASGAPNTIILNPLYATYNLFIILLALGLYLGIKTRGAFFGSIFMTIAGIGGLILYWFPQDYPITVEMTFTGTMHVVFAGVIAFSSLVSMALFGVALRKASNWSKIGRLCLVWLPFAIVLGGFGAVSVTAPSGLAERLSIGSILLWFEVMAISLIKKV